MTPSRSSLPFSAVVGQDDAKLALLLCAVDAGIGGVLLRGDKGSAKTTLARGLADLLPGGAPFVELPVGATEDRLVGTLDIASALTGGEVRFSPGLLASAHGGVLYVDEINLLPDHLVDVLLDVASSGVNRVERDGVSHVHPAKFVLVGSMNPEEGELRPQLLDRFGLAVDVRTPAGPGMRAMALSRRLALDLDPEGLLGSHRATQEDLAARLAVARPARLEGEMLDRVAALCESVGAQGLRADLAICRAAAALAGWEGRGTVSVGDVKRVAPLALAHRAHHDPLSDPSYAREQIEKALEEHLGDDGTDQGTPPGGAPVEPESPSGSGTGSLESGLGSPGSGTGSPESGTGLDEPGGEVEGGGEAGGSGLQVQNPAGPEGPLSSDLAKALGQAAGQRLGRASRSAAGRRGPAPAARGRLVGDRRPEGPLQSVAVVATVRAAASRAASRKAGAPEGPSAGPGGISGTGRLVEASDVREAVREHRRANLIVLAVDASGSMGAPRRVEAAKSAVLSLLRDAYQRRDRVAMVGFRGHSAEVLLAPTGSVEVAKARLSVIATGGRTPLGEGIRAALSTATSRRAGGDYSPLLVVVTDGRATSAPGGADPWSDAIEAAARVAASKIPSLVVDVEALDGRVGSTRLGLASVLAERMGASYVALEALSPEALAGLVRDAAGVAASAAS
ncbi:MAG: ATP-binding protein [Acidimicrobiales bacterium]